MANIIRTGFFLKWLFNNKLHFEPNFHLDMARLEHKRETPGKKCNIRWASSSSSSSSASPACTWEMWVFFPRRLWLERKDATQSNSGCYVRHSFWLPDTSATAAVGRQQQSAVVKMCWLLFLLLLDWGSTGSISSAWTITKYTAVMPRFVRLLDRGNAKHWNGLRQFEQAGSLSDGYDSNVKIYTSLRLKPGQQGCWVGLSECVGTVGVCWNFSV